MADSNPRVSLIVAIIGLAGTLGAAVIGNWSKLFPPPAATVVPRPEAQGPADRRPDPARPADSRPEPSRQPDAPSPARREPPADPVQIQAREAPAPPTVVSVAGLWVDVGAPMNRTEMTQSGNSFSFRRRGVLPNGQGFDAAGQGSLTGTDVRLTYSAQYGFVQGAGRCSGTVSSSGTRMDLVCEDSVLGTFSGTSLRQ